MMGACHEQREFERLLRECGAEFVATNRHEKWRLPNRTIVTFAVSPSDHRCWKNNLANLRKILGLSEAGPSKDTPRAPRRRPRSRPRPTEGKRAVVEFTAPQLRSLAEQLGARMTA